MRHKSWGAGDILMVFLSKGKDKRNKKLFNYS